MLIFVSVFLAVTVVTERLELSAEEAVWGFLIFDAGVILSLNPRCSELPPIVIVMMFFVVLSCIFVAMSVLFVDVSISSEIPALG